MHFKSDDGSLPILTKRATEHARFDHCPSFHTCAQPSLGAFFVWRTDFIRRMVSGMTGYTDKFLRELLTSTKTIAMVGVSLNEMRPSYFVARYLNLKGYRIVPINPGQAGKTLFGQMIYPSLAEIPAKAGPIDMVDIFRRSDHVGPIVDDAIAALSTRGLRTIWMQIGVTNTTAEAVAEASGLRVIMNRCPKIEHQRLFGELRKAGFNTGIISSKL